MDDDIPRLWDPDVVLGRTKTQSSEFRACVLIMTRVYIISSKSKPGTKGEERWRLSDDLGVQFGYVLLR